MSSKNLVTSIFFSVLVSLIAPVSLAKTVPVKESNGDAIEELQKIHSQPEECVDENGNKIICPQ